jgi:hypothetical protein
MVCEISEVLIAASLKYRVFWDVASCSHIEVDRLSEERTAAIISALMMAAVCSCETSVHFNATTRCYIPEDSKLFMVYLKHCQYLKLQCQEAKDVATA